MYYKERIIGAITYGLLLLIFAYLTKDTKKTLRKILRMYAIILSILAYIYIPNPGYDLERIYITFSQYYKPMTLHGLLELLKRTYTPTINVFYYLVSKSGFYGLAPAAASFVFFSCMFSIFADSCEKYNIIGKKRIVYLIFIMSMGTYLEVISNIRCMTAFAIIAYCSYNEIFNKKSIIAHIPIYFIASTMHLAALAITIIRFVIYPFQKKKFRLLYVLLPLTIVTIIYIFYPNYIKQIFFTESYYKSYVSYGYLPEYILMSIMTIYIIFIKIIHRKSIISNDSLKTINIFSIILFMIMILNFSEYSMFHRIGTLHFLINIPIMGNYLYLIKKKESLMMMFIISTVVLLVAGSFGNLCGFKYFIIS